MEEKNAFKIWLFIIFLLAIIIGGYFLMKKYTHLEKTTNQVTTNNTTSSFNDIRIDTKKDYIYFSSEDMISDEYDISFPMIHINFNDNNDVEKSLNDKTENLKKENQYEEDELIKAHYPVYTIYSYENYISLLCDYFIYDGKEELISYDSGKVYVFDKYNGKLYSSSELLSLFNLNLDSVKQKVKSHLNDADLINGEEELDIDSIISSLSMDTLYIDKLGRLTLGIVVKSSEKDYNDVVVLS